MPPKATRRLCAAWFTASLVLGLGLVLIKLAPARPRLAGAAAMIVMTLDLAAANSRYVMTVEQSLFDGQPAVVQDHRESGSGPRSAGARTIPRASDARVEPAGLADDQVDRSSARLRRLGA